MHQEIEYILRWHFKLLKEMDYSVCDLDIIQFGIDKNSLSIPYTLHWIQRFKRKKN